MKLECPCGAKYAFDATPEMLQHPVKFVCPACGLDASDFVNELIRQEFGGQLTPPPPPSPPPPAPSRLKISHDAAPAPQPPPPPVSKFCARHRERATEKCAVCQKPICPKCMEMFGYFCSPLCKGKAEAQHLDVPVYAGQKNVVESRFWSQTGRVAGAMAGAIILFLGVWTWYAWFGSVPHPYFSLRFADDDRGYFGGAQLAGKDQIIFLHGGTLARYDLKTRKPVWSQELITDQQLADLVKAENDEDARLNAGDGYKNHRSGADIERSAKQRLQAELSLRVSGGNIWVGNADSLTHYDWDSGKVLQQISLSPGSEVVERDNEMQVFGAQTVTHVNLATGEARVEPLGPGGTNPAALVQADTGGRPGATGDNGGALDPKTIEAQAQNLNLPGRIALPALLSNARHEQQLEDALKDDPAHPRPQGSKSAGAELSWLVPGPNDLAQLSIRLLAKHLVTRSAMKAPPKKSVLDGNLTAAQSDDAANEILNGMQRDAGHDTVTEDQSLYQVTVHLPAASGAADWTAEVVGPPQLLVLKTVNVVVAGTNVIVLDKSNKKIWQAALTYPVTSGGWLASPYGEGPCVEHGDTLYVFDQAVLTAFELSSGIARWRLPSVGVVGLFFDDQNNVYVNTTTGNPDDVKYSQQIDLNRRTEAAVYKIDPKTGRTVWNVKPGGFVSYLSGKFIYVVDDYDPNPTDQDVLSDSLAGLQKPAYLRIARLRPSDGRVLWEYYDPLGRCPVSVSFDGNSIELIFKREVQVLRYLTF
jgi:outer membrane protein assembly factor BamB